MTNSVTTKVDITTKDGQKALLDLQKSAGDAETSLDDTRTAGQKLADELRQLADKVDTDFQDMRSASDAMATALGDDFVKARTEAGSSVDLIVQGLVELGLTFDDIRGDADQLADAVKRLDEGKASIENLGTAADGTSVQLDKVHTSGDNSRSVLANMVGNSVQDVSNLGGVAGTAGLALGQLGEYAADGNLSLSGLAKVAGPMLALTAATTAITLGLGAMKKNAEEAKRETKLLVEVQEDLRDGKFEDAARKIAEEYKGTIAAAKDYGLTTDDVIKTLQGEKTTLEDLRAELGNVETKYNDADAAALRGEEGAGKLKETLFAQREELKNLIGNLEDAQARYKTGGESIVEMDGNVKDIEASLRTLGGTSTDTADDVRTFSDAALTAKDAANEAKVATNEYNTELETLRGKLDMREAVRNFEEAMITFRAETDHSEASTDEYIGKLADAVEALDSIPTEVKTQMIAELDQGNYDFVESRLSFLARGRNVVIDAQIVGADFNNAREGRASGGRVNAGQAYVVGEKRAEVFVPDRSGTIVPSTAGVGGTVENHYHMEGAVISSRADFERMVSTAVKRITQRGGQI